MTAAAWIALASLAAFVIVQLVVFAFMLGTLFTRVKNLEEEQGKSADCSAALAALNATMLGMANQIKSLEDSVKALLMGEAPRARAARG